MILIKIEVKDGVISGLDVLEKELSKKNGKFILSIKKEGKKRTNDQNSFLMLWLRIIEHETGNDAELLKEFFKEKFLEKRLTVIKGDRFTGVTITEKINPSTAELNTYEFGIFLEKIRVFTYDFWGIILPNPE
jgi:hypothetical protein